MRLTIVSKFYRDIPEFRDVLISWMKSQTRNVGYVFCYESGLKIEFFLWYMLRTLSCVWRVNNYSYKKCFERDLLVKWLREGVLTIIALYRISGSGYRE